MYGKTNRASNPVRRRMRRLRSAAGSLAMALAVVAVLLLAQLQKDASNPYDPALNALLNAQSHLRQSYRPQENLLRDLQEAHRELSAAVDLLASAEQTDPVMTKQIEELRSRLQALEQVLESEKGMEQMTLDELHTRYGTLTTELKELIHDRLERSQ